MIEISVSVRNSYDSGTTVLTEFHDQLIPGPPTDPDEFEEWVYEEVICRFTGTENTDFGDASYDVTVTACSDPALIGRVFDFG